jgi:hypothetical protein
VVTELAPAYDGYRISYDITFSGAQPQATWYNPETETIYIKNPAGATDLAWLTSQGITVGAAFSMTLSLQVDGACTPILYDIPALPFEVSR